jgi:glutamine synthetase
MQLYTAIKRNEIARFHAAVTDWERAEYLELS